MLQEKIAAKCLKNGPVLSKKKEATSAFISQYIPNLKSGWQFLFFFSLIKKFTVPTSAPCKVRLSKHGLAFCFPETLKTNIVAPES